ncbi:MAG: hypothetical protein RL376_480 [Verrucomicrobiota bacterium]
MTRELDNDLDGRGRQRLALLGLAWGVAGVVHHLTFERLGFGSVLGAGYLLATLALVARPASVVRLVGFLVITVAILGREYD